MNNGDVFQKSDLGRQEIKSQSLGILPREARTLLIMIDGKRNYQSYLDTLDNSKMFAEFGGVASLFELLLGLEYIETLGGSDINDNANSNANTNDNTNANATTKSVSIAKTATASSITSQSQSAAPSFDSSIEKEFERTFSGNSPSKNTETNRKSFTSIFKSKKSAASDETIKSDLAIYIEKNAPPAEAWGYLLGLEQCESSSQLLALVKEIQNTSSNNLAGGMNDFIKRMQR